MTLLSIVIPNLNGEQLLARNLRGLADAARWDGEVILVDNGSTDRSVAVAQELLPSLRTVTSPANRGFAAACNDGARAGDPAAEFLLFLNTDVELTEGCVPELLAWAARDEAAAVWQPKLLRADRRSWDSAGSFFTATGFLWHDAFEQGPAGAEHEPRDVFAVKGACFLVRRAPFMAIGGFDESFFAYFEESDLCWRLQLSGWAVRYVPVCCAYHEVGATTTRYFAAHEIDFLSFRNRLVSIVKNAGPGTLLRVLPVHLAACLGAAAALALRGRPRSAAAVLRGLAAAFARPRRLAAARRRSQALRARPDADFLPPVSRAMTAARAARLLGAYLPRW